MKYLYLNLLILLVAASSCSKTSLEPEASLQEKQQVTLKTEGFQQTISELESKKGSNRTLDDTLNKYAPKLYCQIYKFDDATKMDGSLVYNATFKPTDANFGTISAAFEPGSYVAILVASGHPFYRIQGLGGDMPDMRYSECHFNTMTSVALPSIPVDQIFYKKVLFDVNIQPINQQVILTRMVAGLDVIIKDPVPSNVTSIQVVVDDAPIYGFATDQAGGNVDKITYYTPNYNGTNKISTYVLANEARGVQIIAYAGDQIIAQKSLGCTFQKNKKTTLEGKLFTSDASFNLTIDPAWDGAAPVITF